MSGFKAACFPDFISQYIDLGSGLPTASPNVHEVARQVRPDARVVYVDHDPQVAAHGRAACDTSGGLAFLEYDIRDYHGILTYLDAAKMIDFSAPVGVLGVSVLHFVPDEDCPGDVVAAFRWRMAPGSYLVLSHAATDGSDAAVLAEAVSAYTEAGLPAVPRAADGIAAFFTGLDLIEPGLVDVAKWRPDEPAGPAPIRLLAGVGRKRGELPRDSSPAGGFCPVPGRLVAWKGARVGELAPRPGSRQHDRRRLSPWLSVTSLRPCGSRSARVG